MNINEINEEVAALAVSHLNMMGFRTNPNHGRYLSVVKGEGDQAGEYFTEGYLGKLQVKVRFANFGGSYVEMFVDGKLRAEVSKQSFMECMGRVMEILARGK
jgi:hypothetical protein